MHRGSCSVDVDVSSLPLYHRTRNLVHLDIDNTFTPQSSGPSLLSPSRPTDPNLRGRRVHLDRHQKFVFTLPYPTYRVFTLPYPYPRHRVFTLLYPTHRVFTLPHPTHRVFAERPTSRLLPKVPWSTSDLLSTCPITLLGPRSTTLGPLLSPSHLYVLYCPSETTNLPTPPSPTVSPDTEPTVQPCTSHWRPLCPSPSTLPSSVPRL